MKRALKKLQHSAYLWDHNAGRMILKNLRGPPSFEVWLKCWDVFKTAMVMLEQASTSSLEAYEATNREYSTEQYSRCWFLIYIADTRARSEYWDKLLRWTELENSKTPIAGFSKEKPWDYIIRRSVSDECQKSQSWWTKELGKNATAT